MFIQFGEAEGKNGRGPMEKLTHLELLLVSHIFPHAYDDSGIWIMSSGTNG